MHLFRISLLILIAATVLVASTASFAGGTIMLNATGAFFKKIDASGCIETTVDISGQRQTQDGVVTLQVETFIYRRDVCNGIDLIRASESGEQQIEIEAHSMFRFDVAGSFTVFDHVTQQSYSVELDVEWEGTGNITVTNSPNQHHKVRAAEAKGVILFNGENLAADGSVSAAIEQVKTQLN